MGGRSPRRRAQQPAPVVPLKWTSAGVHAVAARPRAAMRGPARPVIHVEIGHFSTSSQCLIDMSRGTAVKLLEGWGSLS